jgi:hypothetical protein
LAPTPPALEAGEADLAIGLLPGLESGFCQQTLFTQDWVCLANRRHQRLADGRLTLRRYETEPHVGIVSGTGWELPLLPRRIGHGPSAIAWASRPSEVRVLRVLHCRRCRSAARCSKPSVRNCLHWTACRPTFLRRA